MRPAREVLDEKLARLKASGARVLLNTEVAEVTGFVGNFEVRLKGETERRRDGETRGARASRPPEGGRRDGGSVDVGPTPIVNRQSSIGNVERVGAIILAMGADLYEPDGEFGYGELPNVITSAELERVFVDEEATEPRSHEATKGIRNPQSAIHNVRRASFILCVGSRCEEGFTGCSRYCCPTAIKQALLLARRGIDTTVFYRDIRTISTGAEEMYREARGTGVLFVRIPPGTKPELVRGSIDDLRLTIDDCRSAGTGDAEGEAQRKSSIVNRQSSIVAAVRCFDDLLGRELEVPTDLVVLSVGMRPRQPDTKQFHEMLKAGVGLDGFFMERHPELAPVETAVEGVLLAGTVQGPKDIVDTVAQASAAAAKASVYLAYDSVKLDPAVAEVDEEKCRGCGTCAEICQFQAPQIVETTPGCYAARINGSSCKGCGTCASWCPSGAIVSKHFTDRQVHAMIDAFFEEPRASVGADTQERVGP